MPVSTNIKRILLPALLVLSVCRLTSASADTPSPAPEDDFSWLDDAILDSLELDDDSADYRGIYLAASLGRDNIDSTQSSVQLQLPASDDVLLDASLASNTVNDPSRNYTTRSAQLGLGSTQTGTLSWHIAGSFWGKRQTVETRDLQAEITYRTSHNWHSSVILESGKLELFLRPDFSNQVTSLSSNRTALGLRIGSDSGTGRWWLSYLKRRYQRDLPRINISRLLQFRLQSIALDQVYALSSDEYTLAYQWFMRNGSLTLELSRITSIVDSSDSDFATVNHRYYLTDSVSLNSSILLSIDDDFRSINLGLGFNW